MSFLLAYSFHSAGFILADTRLNAAFTNGGKAYSDTNPITISLENGDSLSWESKHRKIAPIKTGWCATAGEALTSRRLIDVLKDAPSMSSIKRASMVAEESKKIYPWLPKDTQAKKELRKTVLFFLEYIETGLKLSTIDIDGNITNADVNFAVSWPPELYQEKLVELNENIANISAPQSTEDLFNLILKSLTVFNEVHKNSLTVSKTFEIAILIPQAQQNITLYGLENVETILQKGITGFAEVLSHEKG